MKGYAMQSEKRALSAKKDEAAIESDGTRLLLNVADNGPGIRVAPHLHNAAADIERFIEASTASRATPPEQPCVPAASTAASAAKGMLAEANAALAKYQADVARLTPLATNRAIPKQDLDNALASVEVGMAQAVREMLEGFYWRADFVLPFGRVVHDYLAQPDNA